MLLSKGALTDLNISNNSIGIFVGPTGWKDGTYGGKYKKDDGSLHDNPPVGGFPGVVAIANAIKDNGALETITFGAEQAVTMKADMTEADFSGKGLGASGAMIVAAFLPKCQ